MRSSWLLMVAAFLAAVIFAGNSLVVRGQCKGSPSDCDCFVTVSTSGRAAFGNANPSCSIAFGSKGYSAQPLKSGACDTMGPGVLDRVVMCDVGVKATVQCSNKTFTVDSGTAKVFACSGLIIGTPTVSGSHSGSWVNNLGSVNTNAGQLRTARSLFSRLRGQGIASQQDILVTETESMVIAGEGGLNVDSHGYPRVTLTQGQVTVTSFCDGSTAVFNTPVATDILNNSAALNLAAGNFSGGYDPTAGTCALTDLSGTWRGLYSNQTPGGNYQGDPLTIAIAGNTGTITTADDSLTINSLSFKGGTLAIQATSQTSGGTMAINGTVAKGVMTFNAQANGIGPSGNDFTGGEGMAERLIVYQYALPNAAVNSPYSAQLYFSTPTDLPVSWSIVSGSLPGGMSLDPVLGLISGTAASTGSSTFTVQVLDQNGDTFQQPLTLTVANLTLAANLLPFAYAGQVYQYQLQAIGGQPPYTFTNTSIYALYGITIPGTPQISSSGMVTLDQTSTYAQSNAYVSFKVQDSQGLTQSFVVGVPVNSITLTGSEALPDAVVGMPYTYTFPTAGAAGPITWMPFQDLQSFGLTFDTTSGTLSGTPTGSGSFTLQIQAQDQYGSDSRSFQLNINGTAATASLARPRRN